MARERLRLAHDSFTTHTLELYRNFVIITELIPDGYYYWYVTDEQYLIWDSGYAFAEDEARWDALALIKRMEQLDIQ